MKLFIATSNKHKLLEISAILEANGIIYAASPPGRLPEVEESCKDLRENAILKAHSGYLYSGLPTIADDSGLEVDYLEGAPGVCSARFAGKNCSYADNNLKLLQLLEGVEFQKRTSRFRCVIAFVFGENDFRTVEGSVNGLILEQPRGESGFGYDPLFYYPPLGKTFAQLNAAEKNSISHRARALKELENLLQKGIFQK
ncbi:MAG: non-canonical purine NTP pyrophosphatase, RdgB/HAM1 family [candidate division Zixibacteria bacterium CG_4_9_14_3_um_filter_46_8]|nr:MAG: non-canonical purine NTP pyrophosphatase, RdgB/HAM1 family [candidate division Zixibacteria bacterium CG_4_9_14_3_um_filter_46_8]